MNQNVLILARFAVDWMVAMTLFIVACIGSGWCQQNLTPNVNLYITWFAIWNIPLILYAWRRGVIEDPSGRTTCYMALSIAIPQVLLLCVGRLNAVWMSPIALLISEVCTGIFDRLFPCADDSTSDERMIAQ